MQLTTAQTYAQQRADRVDKPQAICLTTTTGDLADGLYYTTDAEMAPIIARNMGDQIISVIDPVKTYRVNFQTGPGTFSTMLVQAATTQDAWQRAMDANERCVVHAIIGPYADA